MKEDSLKSRKRFSSTISFDLDAKLTELSKRTMIPKTKLIQKALELLLKQYEESEKNE